MLVTWRSLLLPRVTLEFSLFTAKSGCMISGQLNPLVTPLILLTSRVTLEWVDLVLVLLMIPPNSLWLLLWLTVLREVLTSLMPHPPRMLVLFSVTVVPSVARLFKAGRSVLGCLPVTTRLRTGAVTGLTQAVLVTLGLATTAVGPEPMRTMWTFLL